MITLNFRMKGIELYAIETHRLHPILMLWVNNLFGKSNHLILSPQTEAQILFYQGKWKWKQNLPVKESINNVLNYSDNYWKEKLSQLPQNHRFVIDIHLPLFLNAIRISYLWITPWSALPSGRAARADNVRRIGNLAISMTPCFMFLNWQIWGKGILNKPGKHAGNCIDLTTVDGMALYMHEICHIYQFLRNPLQMFWEYIRAIRDSLLYAKILFSHPHISFELEAIAFEWELQKILNRLPIKNSLSLLKKYQ